MDMKLRIRTIWIEHEDKTENKNNMKWAFAPLATIAPLHPCNPCTLLQLHHIDETKLWIKEYGLMSQCVGIWNDCTKVMRQNYELKVMTWWYNV